MTTRITPSFTDSDYAALRDRAANAGNLMLIRMCDYAIAGDDCAQAECARVIGIAAASESVRDATWDATRAEATALAVATAKDRD